MNTLADAIEQVTSAQAGGFDLRGNQPLFLCQEGVQRLAAKSQWIRAQPSLGPTVAGQVDYPLPEKIVRLWGVTVGDNDPYAIRDLRIIWGLRAGRDSLPADVEGVVAESYAEDGKSRLLTVFPEPTEVLPMVGLASIRPDPLDLTDELPFPYEYRRAVVDYAKGIAYEDIDENITSGTYFMNRANAEAEALKMLANARVGQGPWKIPVAGHRRH